MGTPTPAKYHSPPPYKKFWTVPYFWKCLFIYIILVQNLRFVNFEIIANLNVIIKQTKKKVCSTAIKSVSSYFWKCSLLLQNLKFVYFEKIAILNEKRNQQSRAREEKKHL